MLLFGWLVLLSGNLFAQNIREIQAYDKLGGTRIIALMDDNTGKWYTEKTGWQKLPVNEFPKGTVKIIDAYQKPSGMSVETRLLLVMEDNSIWYSVDEKWKQIPAAGLPKSGVKGIEPYVIAGAYGINITTYINVILEDNSLWEYTEKKGWVKIPLTGLPVGVSLDVLQSYQYMKGMAGYDVRLTMKLGDNSVWWYKENKKTWMKSENKNLPPIPVLLFETYMKYAPMSAPEGRMLAVMADNTLWWASVQTESWAKVDLTGLPERKEFVSVKGYPKNSDGSNGSRLIVLLKDNSIWWYAEKKGWAQLPSRGLLD
ncbi:MAG: hypothetical protein H6581_01490 [Bacteroidia bacterium]|nr:hypothetical protein [Bacteroidia bacterium]